MTSQALGIILYNADGSTFNHVVIPRNTKVPCTHEQNTRTLLDGQNALDIKVTQGEERDPELVTVVGTGELSLPAYPKGAPLKVIYAYDVDQTVRVEVIDLTANASLGSFNIERVANLRPEEVQEAQRKIGGMEVN